MKKSVLSWLTAKTKKHIPMLVIVTLLYVALAYLGVQAALETKGLLEIVQKNMAREVTDQLSVWARIFTGEMLVGSVRLIAVVVMILVLRVVTNDLTERLNIGLDKGWKKSLLHKLMHGEFSEVHAYHSGELVNRLSSDVNMVDRGITQVVSQFFQMMTRLIAAAVALFVLDPYMTLVLLGIGIAVALVTTGFRKKLKNLHKEEQKANGKANAFIQEALEKLLIVQAMDVANEMDSRNEALLSDRERVQRRRKNFRILGASGLNLAMNIVYYGALLYSASRLMTGSMTFGAFTAVTALVGQVEGPLAGFSSIISQYISMVGSAERLMELDRIPEEAAESIDGNALYDEMVSIRAENISFTYPGDEEQTIVNQSFTVKKGDFVSVTGRSGAGKSTLLKLLLGIYSVDSGVLSVETTNGSVKVERGTRSLFSYVPQGNLLISGTLRENLLLASPDATEEMIEKAVEISELKEFIDTLPEGLGTVVGESGAGISEGQAQRVSIARAVLRNAPIILLDEATSALDEGTERKVLQNLAAMEGKTVIAVTHRPMAKTISDSEIAFM